MAAIVPFVPQGSAAARVPIWNAATSSAIVLQADGMPMVASNLSLLFQDAKYFGQLVGRDFRANEDSSAPLLDPTYFGEIVFWERHQRYTAKISEQSALALVKRECTLM